MRTDVLFPLPCIRERVRIGLYGAGSVGGGGKENAILWEPLQEICTVMEKEPFLKKILEWRKNEFLKKNEALSELMSDASLFMEEYKRIYATEKLIIRHWYTDPDKKVAYLNNSKVACTSLKDAVSHGNETACKIFCDDEVAECFRFTFVRNPYSRLVSCFKNKYEFSDEKGKFIVKEWSLKHYLMGYLKEVDSFREFVGKVCRIPAYLQDQFALLSPVRIDPK